MWVYTVNLAKFTSVRPPYPANVTEVTKVISKQTIMNIVKLIHDYFKQYTDAPNPALIRDISSQIAKGSPDKSEFEIYIETIGKLRNDLGYSHPIEEQADRADAVPFLVELNRHGNNKERRSS